MTNLSDDSEELKEKSELASHPYGVLWVLFNAIFSTRYLAAKSGKRLEELFSKCLRHYGRHAQRVKGTDPTTEYSNLSRALKKKGGIPWKVFLKAMLMLRVCKLDIKIIATFEDNAVVECEHTVRITPETVIDPPRDRRVTEFKENESGDVDEDEDELD